MFQIFFTDKPVTDYGSARGADAAKFQRLFRGLLASGVFVAPSHYETAFLSDAHTDADASDVIDAYRRALGSVGRR